MKRGDNMAYILIFFEGILTFISPCLLPMLPLYISYLAGSNAGTGSGSSIKNALGFILGFTVIFVSLGAFMGTLGVFLASYDRIISVISGIIMIILGLNFMDVIRIPLLNTGRGIEIRESKGGFFHSALFGMVFSLSWTPCVGTFLGSALMMAATSGGIHIGALMLLVYSLGLGIPFILSALLIDQIRNYFSFIKKHYRIVNIISGSFLILTGILMLSGVFETLLRLINPIG